MDTLDYSTLIGRLELEADHRPPLYRLKVRLVAAAGYVPIAIAALGIVVTLGFLIAPLLSGGHPGILTSILLMTFVFALAVLVRALWVTIELPPGRYLVREEVPALFAAIDEVAQKFASVQRGRPQRAVIDSVILNREFKVSLWQLPRSGVFGNYTCHLEIGVPLLAALSSAEFKTVLAHELGHMGAAHDPLSAWVYRQRGAWEEVERRMATSEKILDRLVARFYGWYAEYFNAFTFVMARDHEYAADRAAARATNARVLGRALVKIELLGRFLADVFWKRLFDQVEQYPEPRYLPYSVLPRVFQMAQKEWSRQDWLELALKTYGNLADPHPGLGERLAALDVPPELPTQVPEKSALALLGEASAALLRWCDEEWGAEYLDAWRKRHETIREKRWKIAQYESASSADLKPEDLWEKSALLLDVGQELDAIQTLQLLVERSDKFGKAHLLLGRLLLDGGNEQGLGNLAQAALQDPELAEEAGQLGYGYLMDRGRKGEAQRFWERLRA